MGEEDYFDWINETMNVIDIEKDITKEILSLFDKYQTVKHIHGDNTDKYIFDKKLFTSHDMACFCYLDSLPEDELAALKGQCPTKEEKEVLNFFKENKKFSKNFPPHLKEQYGKAIMDFLIENFDVQTDVDYYLITKKVADCTTKDDTIHLHINY